MAGKGVYLLSRSLLRKQRQMERIRSNPGKVANIFGSLNEDRVKGILEKWQASGIIAGYIRTEKHGLLDGIGIDFIILGLHGRQFLLQIKTSERWARFFQQTHDPRIKVVVSKQSRTIASIEASLFDRFPELRAQI